jgi:hypothetical protein
LLRFFFEAFLCWNRRSSVRALVVSGRDLGCIFVVVLIFILCWIKNFCCLNLENNMNVSIYNLFLIVVKCFWLLN